MLSVKPGTGSVKQGMLPALFWPGLWVFYCVELPVYFLPSVNEADQALSIFRETVRIYLW